MRKSQSALEYMSTYGWAILIIVIVAGVLYSLGIFNPSSSAGTTVTGFSGLGSPQALCMANGGLRLQLGNNLGQTINVTRINVTSNGVTETVLPNQTISPQGTYIFYVPNVCGNSAGARYSFTSSVTYTEPGQVFQGPYFSSGKASGTVSSTILPAEVAYFQGSHDGSYSSTSYISAPSSLSGENFNWTVTAWVYISQNTSSNPPSWTLPFFAFSPGSIRYEAFAFYSNAWTTSAPIGMTVHVCAADLNSGSIDSIIYSGLLGEWHFVAASIGFYNPKAGYATVYYRLDNNNVSFTHAYNISGAPPILIGSQSYCDGNNFNGYISDVQLYNTNLSISQIQTIKSNGIYGSALNNGHLVSWWPLNGTVGAWVKDYSGDNFNGTMTGPVSFTSNYPAP